MTANLSTKQMNSKQYPYEVYVLRKRVNLSSESSQLYSVETVNQFKEQDLKGVNTIQGKTTEILGTKRDSVTV